MFPEPPSELSSREQSDFQDGWRALITDDLEVAARKLERLDRRHRENPAVGSAVGYLELRLGNRRAAEARFAAVLQRDASSMSARVGWFLTALAAGKDEVAFDRVRLLSRDHPESPLVREYLPALQLDLAEAKLQSARSLRERERYREAAEKYREALRIAPEAGGLYAEAAEAELRAGDPAAAAAHVEKALELQPKNADLYRLRGEALMALHDPEMAAEAYRKALSLRPADLLLAERYQQARRKFEMENLPPEYLSIDRTTSLTREELAALLFVKLRPAFEEGSPGEVQVIATDIGESWAREFIRQVVAAGILDVFPNHAFQPRGFVSRSDLAGALSAALLVLAPALADLPTPGPVIRDVPADNLNYRSVALAVSLGLLATNEDAEFEPRRFVTGLEAIQAVEALSRKVLPR
ncbi:MAG: tetratricopeptide repeat protein [Acidobacteriota bacterium]